MSGQPSKNMIAKILFEYEIVGSLMTFEQYLGLLREPNEEELRKYTTQQERVLIKKMEEAGYPNSQQEQQLRTQYYDDRIRKAKLEIEKDASKRESVRPNANAIPIPDFDYDKLTDKAKKKYNDYVDEMTKNTKEAKMLGGDIKKAFTVSNSAGMSRGGEARPGTKYNTGNVAETVRKRLLSENSKKFANNVVDNSKAIVEIMDSNLPDEKKTKKIKKRVERVKEIEKKIKKDMTDEEKIDFELEESLANTDAIPEEYLGFFNENVSMAGVAYGILQVVGAASMGGRAEELIRILNPVMAFEISKQEIADALGAFGGAVGLGGNIAGGNIPGVVANVAGMAVPTWNLIHGNIAGEVVRRGRGGFGAYVPGERAGIAAIILSNALLTSHFSGYVDLGYLNPFNIVPWYKKTFGMSLPEATLKLLKQKNLLSGKKGMSEKKAMETPLYKLMEEIEKKYSTEIDTAITESDNFTFETLTKITDLLMTEEQELDKGEIVGDYGDFVDKILANDDLMKEIISELPPHIPGYVESFLQLAINSPYIFISAIAATLSSIAAERKGFISSENFDGFKENVKKITTEIKEFTDYLPPFQSFPKPISEPLITSALNRLMIEVPTKEPILTLPTEPYTQIPEVFDFYNNRQNLRNLTGLPAYDFNMTAMTATPQPLVLPKYSIPKAEPILALPSPSEIQEEKINNNYSFNSSLNIMNFQTAYKTYDDLPEYLKTYMTKEQYEAKLSSTGSINNPISVSQSKAIPIPPARNGLLSGELPKVKIVKIPVREHGKFLSRFPVAVGNARADIEIKDSSYQNMIGTATHLNEKGGKKFRSIEYYKEKNLNNENLLGVETRMIKKVKKNPGF